MPCNSVCNRPCTCAQATKEADPIKSKAEAEAAAAKKRGEQMAMAAKVGFVAGGRGGSGCVGGWVGVGVCARSAGGARMVGSAQHHAWAAA
eukprot:308415-Pelagomonas_calceolata.AAC.1